MKWSRLLKFALAVTAAALLLHAEGAFAKEPAKAKGKQTPAAAAKSAAAANERQVKIAVTEDGFEPTPVTLKKDEPVVLLVTRKTEKTCATEFVMKDYAIDTELPLDKEVAIRFTPTKTGKLKYGCGMGQMVAGQFVVE